jgi:hypothetical protein
MSNAPVTDGIRELQSEVAALAVDVLTDLTDERNALKAECERLTAERDALAGQLAAAERGWAIATQLSQYGRHRWDCTLSLVDDVPCSCGLAALRVENNLLLRSAALAAPPRADGGAG